MLSLHEVKILILHHTCFTLPTWWGLNAWTCTLWKYKRSFKHFCIIKDGNCTKQQLLGCFQDQFILSPRAQLSQHYRKCLVILIRSHLQSLFSAVSTMKLGWYLTWWPALLTEFSAFEKENVPLSARDCSLWTEVCQMLAPESHTNLGAGWQRSPQPTPLCLGSCSSWDPDVVKNRTGCLRNSFKDHFRQVLHQNSSCTFILGFPTPEKWRLIKTFEKQPLTDNSSG